MCSIATEDSSLKILLFYIIIYIMVIVYNALCVSCTSNLSVLICLPVQCCVGHLSAMIDTVFLSYEWLLLTPSYLTSYRAIFVLSITCMVITR